MNHIYHIVRYVKAGKPITTLAKIPGIEQYQVGVTYIARAAKPASWVPGERVRLIYSYYLGRDIDCDNTKKVLNDAIAKGLGVDDKIFLSCDRFKVLKDPRPRVEVEVVNDAGDCHCGIAKDPAHG